MFIKLNPPPPQQRYPRTLPELLTAVAKLLTWHQLHDVPALREARKVQQVTRAEFHFLEILGFELATPTPMAWVEIFRRRLSLWQQEQLLQPHHSGFRWIVDAQSGRKALFDAGRCGLSSNR